MINAAKANTNTHYPSMTRRLYEFENDLAFNADDQLIYVLSSGIKWSWPGLQPTPKCQHELVGNADLTKQTNYDQPDKMNQNQPKPETETSLKPKEAPEPHSCV